MSKVEAMLFQKPVSLDCSKCQVHLLLQPPVGKALRHSELEWLKAAWPRPVYMPAPSTCPGQTAYDPPYSGSQPNEAFVEDDSIAQ
ncbi:hypothetical protein QJS10_CPA06g00468 [Acorus calamus]|uniref:Uncharacterized protein n=1 Tax=Acorus calamus TaxID=4465 RepID=A0AAV9EHY0_ACOCL|nr:hypothetical protein QJS10_CPA06g00468 [Acorus calamus]